MSEQFWVTVMIFATLLLTILCPFAIFATSKHGAMFALEWGAYVLGPVMALTGPPLAYYFRVPISRALDAFVLALYADEEACN